MSRGEVVRRAMECDGNDAMLQTGALFDKNKSVVIG